MFIFGIKSWNAFLFVYHHVFLFWFIYFYVLLLKVIPRLLQHKLWRQEFTFVNNWSLLTHFRNPHSFWYLMVIHVRHSNGGVPCRPINCQAAQDTWGVWDDAYKIENFWNLSLVWKCLLCRKNRWKVMLWLMIHDLQIALARTEVLLYPFQHVWTHTWQIQTGIH